MDGMAHLARVVRHDPRRFHPAPNHWSWWLWKLSIQNTCSFECWNANNVTDSEMPYRMQQSGCIDVGIGSFERQSD